MENAADFGTSLERSGRELQDHCAERALILSDSGRTAGDLPDRVPPRVSLDFVSTLLTHPADVRHCETRNQTAWAG